MEIEKVKRIEQFYEAIGLLSGFLGVLSLGIRLYIINLEHSPKPKSKPKIEGYSRLPLPETLHELSLEYD